jgi:putative peptidoglycan lipid II flippase
LLFAFGVVSRATGFGRELLMAFLLGANRDTDALIYSLTFYDMATTFGSAVVIAAIPLFTEQSAAGRPLRHLYRSFSMLMVVVLIPGAFLLQRFAPILTARLEHGAATDTALLGRYLGWMAWSFLLVGVGSLQASLLQARKRFLLPALTGTVLNVAAVAALIAFHRELGAMSIAVGLLVGLFAQVAIQEIGIAAILGSDPRERTEGQDGGLRTFALRMLGIGAGQMILKCMLFVDRSIALSCGPAALSYLGYSSRLLQFPLGLVGLAGATALLPFQSSLKHAGHTDDFDRLTNKALRFSLLLGFLCSAAIAALAHPIIAIAYQRGRFSGIDAAATAMALVAYSGMLAPTFANLMLQNVLFAFARKREYLIISALTLLVYIPLAILLSSRFGFYGIAWASALMAWLYMVAVTWYLHRTGYVTIATGTSEFVASAIAAAGVAYISIRALNWALQPMSTGLVSTVSIQLLFPALVGTAVFFFAGEKVLKIAELTALRLRVANSIGARMLGRDQAEGSAGA